MKIEFEIPIPHWLIPKHIRDNLRQRALLTGTARRHWEGSFLGFLKSFFEFRIDRK